MSSIEETDFEHRVLYEQRAALEEAKQIHSRTYACSYLYPGAISRTTCRVRTTIVYEESNLGSLTISGGTIEKWSDRGWMTVEEYFDATAGFISADEALIFMLNMFKAFILGVPSQQNRPYDSSPPPTGPKPPKKDPLLRVLSFKKYKVNDYEEDKKPTTEDKNDDTPDFDWI